MSQQQKLEKVLELLLNEDSDQAAELLHQVIIEKARSIYESIVEEESVEEKEVEEKKKVEEGMEEESAEEESADDEVGGEPNKDFTDEISTDKEEISADEHNDGEAGEGEGEEGGEDGEHAEGDVEERVDDLEAQLAELRAEFDALMGEEMMEPQHADLGAEMGGEEPAMDDEMGGEMGGMPDMGAEEKVVGEVVAHMFEKNKGKKLDKAPEAKDKKKDKKMDEETKFLNKVADTGQKGKAGLVGTGKDTPLGAENDTSMFTKPTSKLYLGSQDKDNIVSSKTTGGEYGKYHGDKAEKKSTSDNVGEKLKKVSHGEQKGDGKFVGTGKDTPKGATNTKAPLTVAPAKPAMTKKS